MPLPPEPHRDPEAVDETTPGARRGDPYPPGLYAWYVVALLTLVQTCSMLDRSVVAVVIEPIRREFSLNDSQLGMLTGLAYGGSYALASIVLATIIHRLNRRLFLVALVAIWSLFTALAGLAGSYAMLLVARIAVGASEAGGSPTMLSMIADIIVPHRRTTAMGFYYLSASVGVFLSFVLGGFVVGTLGWRAAFFLAGIPGLILAAMVLFTVREPVRGAKDPPSSAPSPVVARAGLVAALRHIVGHRPTLLLLIAISSTTAATSGFSIWIAALFVRTRGLDVVTTGQIAALAFGLFGSLGSAGGGWLADRLGRRNPRARLMVAAGALMLSTLSALACLGVAGTMAAAALFCAYGFFVLAVQAPMFAAWVTIAPARHRGAMMFVMSIGSNFVGYGLGPLLCGLLSDLYGGPNSLSLAIATVLLLNIPAAALMLLVDRIGGATSRSAAAAVQTTAPGVR